MDQEEKAFRPVHLPEAGWVLVANRDLPPLATILQENPTVVAPDQSQPGTAVCLECLQETEDHCPHCHHPLCADHCSPAHQAECALLNRLGGGKVSGPGVIGGVRLLLLRDKDRELWDQIDLLSDHFGELEKVVVRTEEEVVNRMVEIFSTNSINVLSQGRALYPLLSLVSNNCVSNTTYSVNPEDFSVILRARKTILEGEEIQVSHVSPIYGHPRRREKLKEKDIFNCRCPRCLDVTEFGTLASAVKCSDCREGLILPESGEEGSMWRCRFCSNPFEPEMIETMVQKIESNLAAICSNHPTVKLLEAFMRKNSKELYQKHYLNLLAQKHIINLLSEEQNFTRELATKTIRHCKAFKSLMDRLDPGLSGWLYQVERTRCRAQGELAKWDLREQKIDKKTFVEESKKIYRSLQDVDNCKIINDASDEIQ